MTSAPEAAPTKFQDLAGRGSPEPAMKGEGLGSVARLASRAEALAAAEAELLAELDEAPLSVAALVKGQMEAALQSQKAALQALSDPLDGERTKQEEMIDQLFEFTGLSQELDRLQQEHRAAGELRRRLARQQRLAAAAAALRAFHLSMAECLAQACKGSEAEAEHAGADVLEAPLPPVVDADLIDLTDATEPSGPADLLGGWRSTPPRSPQASGSLEELQEPPAPCAVDLGPEENSPPVEDPAAVELRIEEWRRGKNLRALLSSLHEVAPELWQPRSLAELVDAKRVKAAFREALLTFHPDKLPAQPLLGRGVTDALVSASRGDR